MKMLRAVLVSIVALLLLVAPVTAETSQPLTLFSTEQEAQKHCPSDTVVWVNLSTGVYHFKGQRWYGATKSGAYVCKAEADKAGDRPTKNGQ